MMPPPASLLLASVMKSLISSPKALPGQNKLLQGRKVCLRISELDVTCILGLAGLSNQCSTSIATLFHQSPPPLDRYLQSYEVETREQRVGLCSSAGSHLVLAGDVDPGDHLAQFYLGLHLATQRRLPEAHAAAQRALLLQPDHLPR